MRGASRGAWPVDRRGAAALVALSLAAWLILPTAPNYDTATHLVWARELLHGRSAATTAAFAPTMHPLWLLAAVPAILTGSGASVLQLVTIGSFAVVIACGYRLAADVSGRVAGVFAALCVGSSFALILLAFKAYVDVPFLALVMTGLVVERAWQPDAPDRAALTVPVLFFLAGLMRPEAWAFGMLLLVVRVVRGGSARAQLLPAVVVLAAPILWAIADQILSGDPLHSLTGTRALAEELGRPTGLLHAPKELLLLLGDLARPPIAAAGVLGALLAVRFIGWRPLLLPLIVLAAGCAGFILVGALGLPLLQRYLLVPAVLLCVLAGVAAAMVIAAALGQPVPRVATRDGAAGSAREAAGAPGVHGGEGRPHGRGGRPRATDGSDVAAASAARGRIRHTAEFRALAEGTPAAPGPSAAPGPAVRAIAVAALAVGVLSVGGYLVLKADSFRIVGRGVLREARWQRQATQLIGEPAVLAARRCGPITLPTYRFVPELTLRAGLRDGAVVSRSSALGGAGPQADGVALVIAGDHADKTRLGWAAGVPRSTNTTPPGYRPVARLGPFVATAHCG